MPTHSMTDPITDLDATALSRAIHARSVSCREVMQAYLARIDRVNPHFTAIVSRVGSVSGDSAVSYS